MLVSEKRYICIYVYIHDQTLRTLFLEANPLRANWHLVYIRNGRQARCFHHFYYVLIFLYK